MAWHERGPSGKYFICLRVGEQRFRRSLKTNDVSEADGLVARVEMNLRLVGQGTIVVPATADPVSFLLSNGQLNGHVQLPEHVTLRRLFTEYFASIPDGGLEPSTIEGMRIHQRRLEKHFGHGFPNPYPDD